MTGGGGRLRPEHVRISHVEWVEQRMSERDWQILETINMLRLVTTHQLDRLHFYSLSPRSQAVVRGRVISRLIAWRVLLPLPRRIGGSHRGSAATVLTLDSTGRRLLALRAHGDESRLRYPALPGDRTVRHTVAVAELYATLAETCRLEPGSRLTTYATEPACWWPNGLGNYVKPDAYALLQSDHARDHWWIEIDLATESLPTLRRKALTYLDFWQRGQLGPGGIMPRVVIDVPTEQRRIAVVRMINSLPNPASELFLVTVSTEAASLLVKALMAV